MKGLATVVESSEMAEMDSFWVSLPPALEGAPFVIRLCVLGNRNEDKAGDNRVSSRVGKSIMRGDAGPESNDKRGVL